MCFDCARTAHGSTLQFPTTCSLGIMKRATQGRLPSFQIGSLCLLEPILTNVAHFNASHCVKLWQQIRVQILAAASRAAVWNLLYVPDASRQPQKNVPINYMSWRGFKTAIPGLKCCHLCLRVCSHSRMCTGTRVCGYLSIHVYTPENSLRC